MLTSLERKEGEIGKEKGEMALTIHAASSDNLTSTSSTKGIPIPLAHSYPANPVVRPLRHFTGHAFDWLVWRGQSIAIFILAYLLEIIRSPEYSNAHPKENEMAYGMLRIAITANSGVAEICVDKFNTTCDGQNVVPLL